MFNLQPSMHCTFLPISEGVKENALQATGLLLLSLLKLRHLFSWTHRCTSQGTLQTHPAAVQMAVEFAAKHAVQWVAGVAVELTGGPAVPLLPGREDCGCFDDSSIIIDECTTAVDQLEFWREQLSSPAYLGILLHIQLLTRHTTADYGDLLAIPCCRCGTWLFPG